MLTFLKDRAEQLRNNCVNFGLSVQELPVVVPKMMPFKHPRQGMFHDIHIREFDLEVGMRAFNIPKRRDADIERAIRFADLGGFAREYTLDSPTYSKPKLTPPDYSAVGARIAALTRAALPHGVDRDRNPAMCGPVQQTLERAGFTWLGCGHFSVVVGHPEHPNRAFKFGLKKEDSGAAYAAWCRANPGDHVPTVYHTERFQNGYFVVLPLFQRYVSGECAEMDMEYKMACSAIYEPLTTDKEQRLARSLGVLAIADTASKIGAFFLGLAQIDLHGENVMVGTSEWGGKRLIITDPVSFTTSKQCSINYDRTLPVVL